MYHQISLCKKPIKWYIQTDFSLATALSILLLIPSGPVALWRFNMSISSFIPFGVQEIFDNLFRHVYWKSSNWTFVEIDVKYLHELLAFICKAWLILTRHEKKKKKKKKKKNELSGSIEDELLLLFIKCRITFQNIFSSLEKNRLEIFQISTKMFLCLFYWVMW